MAVHACYRIPPKIVPPPPFERNSFFRGGPSSTKFFLRPISLVHASIPRRKGERGKDGIDDAGDGISVDRAGKENSTDLSETSRPPSTTRNFSKGSNKDALLRAASLLARHARIGERRREKNRPIDQVSSVRTWSRREPISKKCRELFFYRKHEERDLRSATSSNRRYSMTLLVKSLNRRWITGVRRWFFRAANGVSLFNVDASSFR